MVSWPEDLVNALARRRTVVFVGSGVSSQSRNADGDRPKTWRQFLEKGRNILDSTKTVKKDVNSLIHKGNYLLACQVIRDRLERNRFEQLLREEFLVPGFQPADVHDAIIGLDSQIYATPNFDKIFETRINSIQANTVAVKNYYEDNIIDLVRGTSRLVLKIHGTIDSPEKMIFTRSEYAEARQRFRSFYSLLDALATTHTFLFVGCGLNDPDMTLILEDSAFKHGGTTPHYFLLPRKEVNNTHKKSIEKSMNVHLLGYDPGAAYENLAAEIDGLRELVDASRINLQDTAQW